MNPRPSDDQGNVIEWAPFRLAEGATEKELFEAAEHIQRGFLDHQPGFVRRHLLRGPGPGEYVDLLYWATEADAKAAMDKVLESPSCTRYLSLLVVTGDPDVNGGVLHFQRARSFGPAR